VDTSETVILRGRGIDFFNMAATLSEKLSLCAMLSVIFGF